jgi:uncharacterized membrane protein YciS (DUF1049 family)
MSAIRGILVLLVILVVGYLLVANQGADQKVDIKLEPFAANRVDVPLVSVLLSTFAGGALLGALVFVMIYIRQSVLVHSARKRIKALEAEVAILRNRPIEESAELLKGADRKNPELKSPFATE